MSDARTDELIDRLLRGSLSAEESAELSRELLASEDVRRRLVELADQEAALYVLAQAKVQAQRIVAQEAEGSCAAPGRASRRYQERCLSARRLVKRRGRGWRMLAAAVVAAGLLAAAGWLWTTRIWERLPADAGGVLASMSGPVELLRGDSRLAACEETLLLPGDRIETGEEARATVRCADGTAVELNERTTLSLAAGGKGGGLALDRGDIYVRATGPMTVNRGRRDEVGVTGTEFDLSRRAEATVLCVAEGQVRFGAAASAVNVGALQASRILPGGEPSRPEAISLAQIAPWRVRGTGLKGEYFDNMDLTVLKLTRTDATVNFDWGSGSPDANVDADTFSVRWTGQVQARFTETYTFYTVSDDGVRLWINGQLVVDSWVDQPLTEHSGTIALVAGQKCDLKMEYYENDLFAVARLLWSSASTARQVVPQAQLYPASSVAPPSITAQPANATVGDLR